MNVLMAFFSPGPMEMMIIGVIAVLLFGKRLPEVGRSLGKGIVEFKKGVRGIEDELEAATTTDGSQVSYEANAGDYHDEAAPKYSPPVAETAPPTSPDA